MKSLPNPALKNVYSFEQSVFILQNIITLGIRVSFSFNSSSTSLNSHETPKLLTPINCTALNRRLGLSGKLIIAIYDLIPNISSTFSLNDPVAVAVNAIIPIVDSIKLLTSFRREKASLNDIPL